MSIADLGRLRSLHPAGAAGGAVSALSVLLALLLAWVVWPAWASTDSQGSFLVETAWVAAHGQDPGVRLLDVRSLGEYRQGHIPGAVHFEVAEVRVEREGVKAMLPAPDELNALFGRYGISPETTVVVYDAQGGLWASRVWFALDYMGHKDVKLLNGGWLAWSAEGRTVTRAVPRPEPAVYAGKPDPAKVADAAWVLAHLKDPSVKPLDARSPAEYAGDDVRSARGGHVPGAVNINWVETVSGPEMKFKSAEELQSLFQGAGITKESTVVPYCQSHVRGSQVSFVLRMLGYDKVRGYDGSWQEWGNRQDLPVEK